MGKVIISGALANKPFNGGNAWSRLSWILGFKRLGLDVCFIEEIAPSACLDPNGVVTSFEQSINLAYFRSVMKRFGLGQSSALIYDRGQAICGRPLNELVTVAEQANLLFNLSGHLTLPEIKEPPRCKVYYDDDPGFTQFWHAAGDVGARLEGHDFFVTIGENIGAQDCDIPTDGIRWGTTRPPVILDEWPPCPAMRFDRFTTVASWRGAYAPIQSKTKTYGVKAHEFRKLIGLPQRNGTAFEIALQIHSHDKKDLDALQANGWIIVDPKAVAASPDDFRHYVQTSGAEFSVAQGIYVETNSGWFSDRTVRYLASGKPALVQDTGFSRNYPVGKGLLTFRCLDEALQGAEAIAGDYETHCRAARQLAEEYFDSNTVIRELAQEIALPLP